MLFSFQYFHQVIQPPVFLFVPKTLEVTNQADHSCIDGPAGDPEEMEEDQVRFGVWAFFREEGGGLTGGKPGRFVWFVLGIFFEKKKHGLLGIFFRTKTLGNSRLN